MTLEASERTALAVVQEQKVPTIRCKPGLLPWMFTSTHFEGSDSHSPDNPLKRCFGENFLFQQKNEFFFVMVVTRQDYSRARKKLVTRKNGTMFSCSNSQIDSLDYNIFGVVAKEVIVTSNFHHVVNHLRAPIAITSTH